MIRARQSRLSKVEEATAPVSRKIIVWDDHKGPEDTAKKIAAQRESGRASEHDQFIVVGWQR
jgi:hypothetical protein